MRAGVFGLLPLLVAACMPSEEAVRMEMATTFGDDLAFLEQFDDVVVLSSDDGQALVAVSPSMQGRVLTSSASGPDGMSFGWINREAIASGERQEHINVFGGEDRFWLGPEGGQYSIFFAAGDPFDLDHWYVPSGIDWDPWEVTERDADRVAMTHAMELTNWTGTEFRLRIDREVRLLRPEVADGHLGLVPDVDMVAFESVNTITNTGDSAWTHEGGLLSIWILSMYNPSPTTTIVIPYVQGSEEELGQIVNDAYFGTVPPDRLMVTDRAIFFKGDGEYRAKLGLSKARSQPTFGSYDSAGKALTLVQYSMPQGAADYVNSMWEIQSEPYAGDVINSYNDGPPAPGVKPLGPFYELETSSPAAALSPGESLTHVHRTFHLQGPEGDLDSVATATFGLHLTEIEAVFSSREQQ